MKRRYLYINKFDWNCQVTHVLFTRATLTHSRMGENLPGSSPSWILNKSSVSNTSSGFNEYLLLEEINSQQFQFQLPATIYTTILMMVGTPGNILVLYVYFLKWRKSTSRMFILFLTGLDLVNCVTTLPMEIFVMRYPVMLDRPWLCKIARFSTYTMNSSSAAILVAIAVDRFKRICRPHGPQFSAKMSKYICIFCIMLALAFSWPSLLIYGTRVVDLGVVEGKACLLENKFDTSVYPVIYFVVMMASTVVIFTTLSILYYFVGLQVYRHRKNRLLRKAESIAAKNLVIQEQCSHSNNDTLLQDSDSTELRKSMKNALANAQAQDNTTEPLIELKPMSNGCNGATTPVTDHTEIDLDETTPMAQIEPVNANDENSKIEEVKSSSDKTDEQTNDGNRQKRSKTKNRFSKRNGVLKDSLTKSNGSSCIHMKLRIGRSTLMLFLITLAYIVSFLPFYVLAIIRQAYKGFVSELDGAGYMTYLVFLRSYLLSSAINPIIYSFCNAQFRTFCFDMFSRNRVHRSDM